MKETYFIIRNSDGDTTITTVTKEQLINDLNDGMYTDAFTKMPEDSDTNYWGGHVLIIKGTVVSPKAEEVVTRYNID
ncbi:MAG: hypothetical protein WC333_02225 [Dehalococcoidia bacterium]|jgi:hypothetical protein